MIRGGFQAGLSAPRRARGVSLLEMLLVVMLIAIAATLAAMVLTGGLDGMRLRSHTRELAAQLRYTRAQAMATGQPQRFVINPKTHDWYAPNQHRGTIPAALGVSFTGARQVQPQADEGAIVFFYDGGSSGGRIRLSSGKAVWQVDVAWLTGQVRISRAQQESLQ